VSLGAAATQFVLRHPAVTAVVVGARSAGEITEDAGYMSAGVPEDLFTELNEQGLIAPPATPPGVAGAGGQPTGPEPQR
jgi:D-threo-aldose 1-dehydrogenase